MKILPKKAIQNLEGYSAYPRKCKVKLDANESPYDLPRRVKNSIFGEIKHIPFNRYPDPLALDLRRAFARKTAFPVPWIMAGNGSDELILYLSLAFARKRVLFFSPTFSMYNVIGISSGAEAVGLPLRSGFELPVEDVDKIKADIIFISTPNNPTGNCFKKEDVLLIVKKTSAIVAIDEAYAEFCRDSFLPCLKKFENLVIFRTFSKAFGLAGIRVGFMIARPCIIREVEKVRLPYNMSLFSQVAGRVILEKSIFLKKKLKSIIMERERVFENLCRIGGVSPYPSRANFILFRTPFSSDKLYSYLAEKGVLVRNLNGYAGLRNCVRVTIGTREENDIFLRRLRSYLR